MRSTGYLLAGLILGLTISFISFPELGSELRQRVLGLLSPLSRTAWNTSETISDHRSKTGPSSGKNHSEEASALKTQSRTSELQVKLRKLQSRNTKLKRRIRNLQVVDRLTGTAIPDLIPARILPFGETSPWRSSILINQGSKRGVENGSPVVFQRTLVGKVQEVGTATSRVQLVHDSNFRLEIKLIPPGQYSKLPEKNQKKSHRYTSNSLSSSIPVNIEENSNPRGILRGSEKNHFVIEEILSDTPVEEGWKIMSVKRPDSPVPPGLLIGEVFQVSNDYGKYLKIFGRPNMSYREILRVPELFVLQILEGPK